MHIYGELSIKKNHKNDNLGLKLLKISIKS